MFESERSDGRAEPVRDEPSSGIRIGARRRRRQDRGPLVRTASLAAVLSFAAVFGLWRWEGAPPAGGSRAGAQAPKNQDVAVALAEGSDRLLDPTPLSGAVAPKFGPADTAGSSFRLAFVPPAARADARGLAAQAPAQPAASPAADTIRIAASPPLPMPRPPELSGPEAPESSRMAAGSRRARTAALPPAPADTRSFFDKLFGVQSTPTPGTALAYAAPESSPRELAPGVKLSPAPTAAEPGTALYDISARVVYMPNGERLEAHSGLGDKIDDPRFVHVRMHGATPPGTYDLTERERPRRPPCPHLHAGSERAVERLRLVPPVRQVPPGLSPRRGETSRRRRRTRAGRSVRHLQQPYRRRRASRPQRVSGGAVATAPPIRHSRSAAHILRSRSAVQITGWSMPDASS
jgi:hypothetical protein